MNFLHLSGKWSAPLNTAKENSETPEETFLSSRLQHTDRLACALGKNDAYLHTYLLIQCCRTESQIKASTWLLCSRVPTQFTRHLTMEPKVSPDQGALQSYNATCSKSADLRSIIQYFWLNEKIDRQTNRHTQTNCKYIAIGLASPRSSHHSPYVCN